MIEYEQHTNIIRDHNYESVSSYKGNNPESNSNQSWTFLVQILNKSRTIHILNLYNIR